MNLVAVTNGTVNISNKSASAGAKITLTPTPNSGYKTVSVTAKDKLGNIIKLTKNADATVNRAQVVTFLYRYEKAEAGTESGFADVAEDAWFASAVAWAVENGITNGTGDGQFSPAGDCTRGQIVTFLWRDMVR